MAKVIVTLAEASKLTGVSERTLRRWIKAGKLESFWYRMPSGQKCRAVERDEVRAVAGLPFPAATAG
jgi:excisionase family DNA binding protein